MADAGDEFPVAIKSAHEPEYAFVASELVGHPAARGDDAGKGFGIDVVGGETVRESDGLALSSRNVHLGPVARKQALRISESLRLAQTLIDGGERSTTAIIEAVQGKLSEADQAVIDYAELRDPADLERIGDEIAEPTLLAIALQFEPDPDGQGARVRLIDNCVLTSATN